MGVFGCEDAHADWTGTGGAQAGDITCVYTLAEDASVTNVSAHCGGAGGHVNMKAAIYDVVGGQPTNLLVQSGVVDVLAQGWYDFAIAETALVAADYGLALLVLAGEESYGAGGSTHYHTDDGGVFPNPYGAHSDANLHMSIHADYHVEGGAVSKKRMLMGVGLQARTPKFQPRKVVPYKCPLPLFP